MLLLANHGSNGEALMLKNVLSRALNGVKSHASNLEGEAKSLADQIVANCAQIDRLSSTNYKLQRKADRRTKFADAISSAVAKFEAEDEGE
jgi:hypothetical protein